METFVGGFVTVALGIIVVAAIFQLGSHGNPIVPVFGDVASNAVKSLFKDQ